MLNKILFVYIFSVVIFYNYSNKNDYHYYPQNKLLVKYFNKQRISLQRSFKHKIYANLLIAFISGEKKILKKKTRSNYKSKNLYHLFTPSGLHYSSLYFLIIFFLKKKFKKEIVKYISLLLTLLSLSVFIVNRYYSLKRIVLFYFLKNLCHLFKIKLDNFAIFLAVFIIDYYIGNFSKSPFSFIYSFLFLGAILASKDTFKSKLLSILFAQGILSLISGSQFNLVSGIKGFILTWIFSLIFPILLSNFFFTKLNYSEIILALFNKLVTL